MTTYDTNKQGIELNFKNLAFVFALLIAVPLLSIAMPSKGCATSAQSSCDPLQMEAMEQRGWKEAQREITQNQNYINKQDSVLEYTCFDQPTLGTGSEIAELFADSNEWGVRVTDWVSAADPIIVEQSADFINAAFPHDAGGGTWGGVGGAYADSADPCPVMNDVWYQARDENFIPDPATDGFYTFREYMEMPDPRVNPEPYAGPAIPWEEAILIGENIETVNGRPPNDFPGGYPFRDPLEIDFVEEIRPRLVPGAPTAPVGTGPNIITSPGGGGNQGPDGICTNPGTTYVGGTCI